MRQLLEQAPQAPSALPAAVSSFLFLTCGFMKNPYELRTQSGLQVVWWPWFPRRTSQWFCFLNVF